MDDKRAFLRHTLATLAYRGNKAIDGAPDEVADTRACPTCRSAVQILAHLGDLMDWALTLAQGQEAWTSAPPQTWAKESCAVCRWVKAPRRFSEGRRSAGMLRRALVSRTDRRRTHARWPDRHAEALGRRPGARRKLL